MAVFNKILNILIFILAGVSVTFGFFLFEKREELRKRGDYMAKVINEVSGILDAGSNTGYQEDLDYKNRYQLNPAKENYDKGKNKISLYHNNYAKLKTVLNPFKDQARDIISQRDALSSTLHNVLVDLKIPTANEFEAPTFMAMDTYNDQDTKLLEIVKKVTARDEAIHQQIADSVGVMGGSIDPAGLWDLEDYTTPLSEFATVAQKLKTRSDTYESSIGELYKIFFPESDKSVPALDVEDYDMALNTIRTEMQGQKDLFEATKRDLAQAKQDIKDLEAKVAEKVAIIAERDAEIVALNKKLEPFLGGHGDKDEELDMFKLKRKLEGEILRVNEKWGFVVINLGLNNKMTIGNKKKVEKIVPLDEDIRMDVRRGSKYLGQIHIVKVAENCAIGNIIPETITAKMEPGDDVNIPRENKSINQDVIDEGEEDF